MILQDMEPDQKLLNMDKLLVGPVGPLEEELDKDVSLFVLSVWSYVVQGNQYGNLGELSL